MYWEIAESLNDETKQTNHEDGDDYQDVSKPDDHEDWKRVASMTTSTR